MLQAKQYTRGVLGIKLVHEVLFRMLYSSMQSWIKSQGRSLESQDRDQKLQELRDAFTVKDVTSAARLIYEIENEHLHTITQAIEDFRKVGREQFDILPCILRAERDANFELHLATTCDTMPWLCAAGRHQYAKFIPTYVADMKALEQDHPQSYSHMCDGGFVVFL